MHYNGTWGQILKLHLMNLFLNIITIGIYSFWGKTRIRRYMTSHITIGQDRFEYTGTGKELFLGWLKALLIFIPLLICLSIPIINIPAFIAFFGLLSIALYLALRYRLSRTKWRGIRFNLAGSIKEYFMISIKRTFINIVTLGWKIPKSDIIRWSYIANHMSYGDLKFSYEGDDSRLRKIHLMTLSILIGAVLVGLVPLIGSGVMKGIEKIEKSAVQNEQSQLVRGVATIEATSSPEAYDEDGYPKGDEVVADPNTGFEKSIFIGIIAFYALFGLGFIGRLWYQAALWQEQMRGLRLEGLRFKSDVIGKELAWLLITNILLIICTLGIGKPIAAQRTLRYYITKMRIGGDLEGLLAKQDKAHEKSGMGDALAADVGFDMGM